MIVTVVGIIACDEQKSAYQRLAIYGSAHPDDWQLFMGEQAWKDIQDSTVKTVFLLTTAGDAAMGLKSDGGATMPYYLARERGYINSLLWADQGFINVDKNGRSLNPIETYLLDTVEVNNKAIKKIELQKSTAYLLYLPDGFPEGSYTWSLQKLKEGGIESMPAIDSSAVYTTWYELRDMVAAIIQRESEGIYQLDIHLAEQDTALNPDDHSDHLFTSKLVTEAIVSIGYDKQKTTTFNYYREYHTAKLDSNLTAEEIKIKQYLFSANALSKEMAGYPSPWDTVHLPWTTRSYFRSIDANALNE